MEGFRNILKKKKIYIDRKRILGILGPAENVKELWKAPSAGIFEVFPGRGKVVRNMNFIVSWKITDFHNINKGLNLLKKNA